MVNPITRQRLRRIAFRLRLKLEKDKSLEKNMWGACGIASILLSKRLSRMDIPHQIAYSGDHAFVLTHNGYIVDVTATQFDGPRTVVRKSSLGRQWSVNETFDTWQEFEIENSTWTPNSQYQRYIENRLKYRPQASDK